MIFKLIYAQFERHNSNKINILLVNKKHAKNIISSWSLEKISIVFFRVVAIIQCIPSADSWNVDRIDIVQTRI